MADEYIRLDTTINVIDNLINEAATGTMARTLLKAKEAIYNQQRYVIDVQSVKHGRWLKRMSTPDSLKCSVCGNNHKCLTTECPNCGAIMDLKDGDIE